MNGGFHRCRREIFPRSIHWSSKFQYRVAGASSARFYFCRNLLEDFLKISMVGDLHIVEFQPCPFDLIVITSHQFPAAPWTCRFTTPHQFSRCRKIECHLVATIENVLLGLGRCLPPVSWRLVDHNSAPTLDSAGCSKHPNLSEEVCFALRRFLDTIFLGLGLGTAEPSLDVLSWALMDMTTLLSVCQKMAARKHRDIHGVQRIEQDGPHSSRVTLPLVNMSASWFWVSTYLIRILGSKLILSNNQSSATLWVLDTCLFVGLRAFDEHLDHNFVIFTDVQLRLALRRICVCGDVVHMRQLINISVSLLFGFGFVISRTVSCCLIGLVIQVLFDERNTSITTSHMSWSRSPSILKPAFNEIIPDSVELWDTDVCFFHIQMMRNECSTSEDT